MFTEPLPGNGREMHIQTQGLMEWNGPRWHDMHIGSGLQKLMGDDKTVAASVPLCALFGKSVISNGK
jgi:hypothetical protein